MNPVRHDELLIQRESGKEFFLSAGRRAGQGKRGLLEQN